MIGAISIAEKRRRQWLRADVRGCTKWPQPRLLLAAASRVSALPGGLASRLCSDMRRLAEERQDRTTKHTSIPWARPR